MAMRLDVLKTYKLFVNGKFPRSESGRTMPVLDPRNGKQMANCCRASRKDLRDAVRAARGAFPEWAATTPYLRGQILYRFAEMLESRSESMAEELRGSGSTPARAKKEVEATCDRLVYYAGWSDKYAAVAGSVNPVSSPHFNFTQPEPVGVVGLVAPESPTLLAVVSLIAATIISGNTVIALAPERQPLPTLTLGEVCAVSDIPSGVVNLLSGLRSDLVPVLATHMDINAIVDGSVDPEQRTQIEAEATTNLKRTHFPILKENEWFKSDAANLENVLRTVELKSTWHPRGLGI